jgi:hypothetical protein
LNDLVIRTSENISLTEQLVLGAIAFVFRWIALKMIKVICHQQTGLATGAKIKPLLSISHISFLPCYQPMFGLLISTPDQFVLFS